MECFSFNLLFCFFVSEWYHYITLHSKCLPVGLVISNEAASADYYNSLNRGWLLLLPYNSCKAPKKISSRVFISPLPSQQETFQLVSVRVKGAGYSVQNVVCSRIEPENTKLHTAIKINSPVSCFKASYHMDVTMYYEHWRLVVKKYSILLAWEWAYNSLTD